MNKTISINIAGFVFNIEEEAYDKLNHYLNSIKKNFNNEIERDEIMEDIEARIAELFQERLSDRKEVVVNSDVESIIVVMGTPEDYITEDEPIFESEQKTPSDEEYIHTSRHTKRLFRDEDDGVVGGVCSGLGYYFGIDPVLVRVAFVVLTFLGAGVLVYIILWIVIPSAKTTAEILEMKGESVTLDSIKEHVQDAKNSILSNTKSAKKNIKKAVDNSVRAGSKVSKVLSKIIGGGLLVWGSFALLALLAVSFGNSSVLSINGIESNFDLSTLVNVIYPDGRVTLFFSLVIIVSLIPIIFAIVFGVKLLFGIKTKFKKMSITLLILWLLSVGILVLINIELGLNFKSHQKVSYDLPLEKNDSSKVLFVDIFEDSIFSEHIEFNEVWNMSELIKIDQDKVYLGFTNLDITVKDDSSNFKVIIHKESNGFSNKNAINRAEKIEFDIEIKDNKLLFSPYFIINALDKYRGQIVTVEIQVPLGKEVKFGKNIDRVFIDIENSNRRRDEGYANTIWSVDRYNDLWCRGVSNLNLIQDYPIEVKDTIVE